MDDRQPSLGLPSGTEPEHGEHDQPIPATATTPRALPRTGDSDSPVAALLALAAVLLLGGFALRRRTH